MLVWVGKIAPLYDRFLTAASQGFLSLSEAHNYTTLTAGEPERIFLVPRIGPETLTPFGSPPLLIFIRTNKFHINLALLLALFMATPGLSFIPRLRLTSISLGILFLVHVLIMIIYVKNIYAPTLNEYSPFLLGPIRQSIYKWSYVFLRGIGWPAIPLMIWSAMLVPVFLKRHKTDNILRKKLQNL